ncbi:MAG TPA: tyrosine-type recombinase/integrase [Thermoanaerobaculia bacterium]|nr:tyrosine-type recombinase/integrase [Thermoanaerobaculia bacterium]
MLLSRAVQLFLEGYFATCERSPKTIAAYTSDLEQLKLQLGPDAPLAAVTPEQIEAWARGMKAAGLAPASIRRKLAVAKILFNYWVRRDAIPRSPLWQLRLDIGRSRQLTRTLTVDEIRRLLAEAKRRAPASGCPSTATIDPAFVALRNRAVLELLFATGIRVGEAMALRLEDVNLAEGILLIHGKGARERLAFLTDTDALEALTSYHHRRAALSTEQTALFLNTGGAPLSPHAVATALRDFAQGAGITRHLTPHMLRHTSATLFLQNGADLRVVQEFLGHASIATTQRYTHITRAHLVRALERCRPGLGVRG